MTAPLHRRAVLVALAAVAAISVVAGGLTATTAWAIMSPTRALAAGVLASLAGMLLARRWPSWERAAATAALAVIALAGISDAGAARLAAAPGKLSELGLTEYCEERRPAPRKAVPPTPAPARGCALVRRAVELGYAEDLGPCATGSATPPVAKQPDDEPARCRDRHRDEPLVHYLWRVASDELSETGQLAPAERLRTDYHELEVQLGYLAPLLRSQRDSLVSAPKAAHHIYTNLPRPSESVSVVGTECGSGPDGLTATTPSAALAMILHHLVFDPRFGAPAGNCRDYFLHWDTPVGHCRRLEVGDLPESAETVLGRRATARDIYELDRQLDRGRARPVPAAARIVTVTCLEIDPDRPAAADDRWLPVDGGRVAVRTVVAPALDERGAGLVDGYRLVARALVGGAHLPSEAAATFAGAASADPEMALLGQERLLRIDPFVSERPRADDEIYPITYHLMGFIGPFRRRLAVARGRL